MIEGQAWVEFSSGRVSGAPAVPFDRGRWRARAACRGLDPELFFPERGVPLAAVRAVCAGCPVVAACDEYGLWEKHGVWAGQAERRRKARRSEVPLSAVG